MVTVERGAVIRRETRETRRNLLKLKIMSKTIKVTGSMTVSKMAMEFFPSGVTGGTVTLILDGTTVAATEKRATNNLLSLESLCFALLKSGVVAKSNLANVLALAAESKAMDEATAAEVAKLIEDVKAKVATTLPLVPVAASLRVKGEAVAA